MYCTSVHFVIFLAIFGPKAFYLIFLFFLARLAQQSDLRRGPTHLPPPLAQLIWLPQPSQSRKTQYEIKSLKRNRQNSLSLATSQGDSLKSQVTSLGLEGLLPGGLWLGSLWLRGLLSGGLWLPNLDPHGAHRVGVVPHHGPEQPLAVLGGLEVLHPQVRLPQLLVQPLVGLLHDMICGLGRGMMRRDSEEEQ